MLGRSVAQLVRSILILMRSKMKFIFLWTWNLALCLLIVGKGFPPIRESMLTILSSIFIVASVYIYNDINDVEMDKENEVKKYRPIVSGLISKSDAQRIVYLLGFIGLSLAWLVNLYSFSFLLIFYILFYAYSYPPIRLKKRLFGKDFTLFIATPILCLTANYAISNDFSIMAFSSALLSGLLSLTSGPAAREAEDIVEDKKYGVRSISTMFSWETKIRFMILGIIMQMILVPFIQFKFGSNLLLPVISVVILLLLLRFSYSSLATYDYNNFKKAYNIGFLHWLISPITFVLLSSGIPLFF